MGVGSVLIGAGPTYYGRYEAIEPIIVAQVDECAVSA